MKRFLIWWPDAGETEETAETFEASADPLAIAASYLQERIPDGALEYIRRAGAYLSIKDTDSEETRTIRINWELVPKWSAHYQDQPHEENLC